jgi:methionyl aminopeptidase
MSIQTEAELDGLRRAGRVVAAALRAAAVRVAVGVTTAELDDVVRAVLASHGARPTPEHALGFPGAACISVNDEAVHGIPGGRRIEPDDVVKIDVTADLDGYVADAARTLVADPRSASRARLAWCARSAFDRGLAAATAGRGTHDIGAAVDAETRRRGFRVIRALCGHGIGRAMHEPPSVPNYREPRMAHRLAPGLVITVEPIICAGSGDAYEAADGWTVRTRDGSVAAHHEETIVITRGRPLVLTAA